MNLISIVSHQTGASAPAAIGLAQALAAAGHHVALREGLGGGLHQALGLTSPGSATLAPRLAYLPAHERADASTVVVVDDGALTETTLPPESHVVLVVPATVESVDALVSTAKGGRALAAPGQWLGVMIVDGGDDVLRAKLAHELKADSLGDSSEACAAAVSTKLHLVPPAPNSLSDLAGIRFGSSSPAPASVQATSQYTYVLDGAAVKEAGVSSALVTASEPNPSRPPSLETARLPAPAVSARQFGLLAVAVPWAVAAVLASLLWLRA
jgi:hypothetical protein